MDLFNTRKTQEKIGFGALGSAGRQTGGFGQDRAIGSDKLGIQKPDEISGGVFGVKDTDAFGRPTKK